jgi:LysR family transcriptional regulator, glycine cleavage system transcriptional activator
MGENELPPLNAIRAFEAAARRGSFVEAANDLHVTHWAIGKQIRHLEDWLGVPLFERRARGVALTDQGADLLTDVSAALSRLTSATGRLRGPRAARRVSGVVRVNVLSSFAQRWLLPRLSRFQESYSSVEVKISTTSRKLRYVGTAFDIGIRSGVEHGSGIHCETPASCVQPRNLARPSGGNCARLAAARSVAFHNDALRVAAMAFGGGRLRLGADSPP